MRRLLPALLALALVGPFGAARAALHSCDTSQQLPHGTIGCESYISADIGGTADFDYYVPEVCTASAPCPVLYLLHGFGGNAGEMLGWNASNAGYFVADEEAGTSGAQFILIAPDGRTVPSSVQGAPPADLESFWVDWNPVRYHDAAPRFEHQVTQELRARVESSFPTVGDDPAWRAISGVSLGGLGSFKLAMQHPDMYSSATSFSGAMNILVGPDVQPVEPPVAGVGGVPVATTYAQGPEKLSWPNGVPFGDAFSAFGDPESDEAYYRGNNPLDLALNGTAFANTSGSDPALYFMSNNLTPAPADVPSGLANFFAGVPLEALVAPMNAEMVGAVIQDHVPFTYQLHTGSHQWTYWQPYVDDVLKFQWARAAHASAPKTLSAPASFNFRSISTDFEVWGWHVHVAGRAPTEFLTMWNARADGVTLQGSGTVTITNPAGQTKTVDLGPSGPTDEHLGAGGIPAVAHSATVNFNP